MREPAKSFEDLVVWQRAHAFVLWVYKQTRTFPADEKYGLTAQLRRAAVSVPANIVEGFKRRGNADKKRFFNIAQASLEETRYYLLLARDLCYAEASDGLSQVDEVSRLLGAYFGAMGAEGEGTKSG
ncbi:MAG: four helix bundle protein [Planctomycetota bacterium]